MARRGPFNHPKHVYKSCGVVIGYKSNSPESCPTVTSLKKVYIYIYTYLYIQNTHIFIAIERTEDKAKKQRPFQNQNRVHT